MACFSLRLTERADEAAKPANNLALALAFAGVGLFNMALALVQGESFDLLRLIF